jgi:hypothetical protein
MAEDEAVSEMISFVIFAVVVGTVVYLHFAMAHRAWRKLAARPTAEIDPDYVRIEDYFGRSFRQKMEEWLKLPETAESTPQIRKIQKGQERILAMAATHCPAGRRTADILVIDGGFTTDENCTFTREIYVTGDCRIGSGSTLQALAVDGALEFGDGVVVRRWVDARASINTGRESRVDSRLTSRTRITLGAGTRTLSAFAPEVRTEDYRDAQTSYPRPANALEIPPRVRPGNQHAEPNFDPKLLIQASADTWIYRGDLKPTRPLYLRSKLVVRGECTLPPGSYLEDDLKATGKLVVGRTSLCRGSLVSDSGIRLESDVLFEAQIYAGGDLHLESGVRGGGDTPVVAYAARRLFAETNVEVKGKLAAGLHVVAAPAGYVPAEEFLEY